MTISLITFQISAQGAGIHEQGAPGGLGDLLCNARFNFLFFKAALFFGIGSMIFMNWKELDPRYFSTLFDLEKRWGQFGFLLYFIGILSAVIFVTVFMLQGFNC